MSSSKAADPSTRDFLTSSTDYEPWNYREGWETRLVRKLYNEIKSNKDELPLGTELSTRLAASLSGLWAEGVLGKTTKLPIHEVTQYLKLPIIEKLVTEFGYDQTTIENIGHLGDAYFRNVEIRPMPFAEFINKKRFVDSGKLIYWVNPNKGESTKNTIEDNQHQVILWDEYIRPDPSQWKIQVKSIKGFKMISKDKNGLSDPYIEIGQRIDGKWHQLGKAPTIKKTLNPDWPSLNASFTADTAHHLIFVVNDWDLIGHSFMGVCNLDLQVIKFLDNTYKKNEITVLQRVSGIKYHEKEQGWKPIISGVLEIVLSFSV